MASKEEAPLIASLSQHEDETQDKDEANGDEWKQKYEQEWKE